VPPHAQERIPGASMTAQIKNMEALTPEDFIAHPVWEFALDMEHVDEFAMRPVTKLPVNDLANRIVGTRVVLANGTKLWAGLSNVVLGDGNETRSILIPKFYVNDEWVPLDRPGDFKVEMYGPEAFARRLGLSVGQVFPIAYDISDCCVGDKDAVRGTIESTRS